MALPANASTLVKQILFWFKCPFDKGDKLLTLAEGRILLSSRGFPLPSRIYILLTPYLAHSLST